MTIDDGAAIILLVYLFGSMGLIVTSLLAIPVLERVADWLRERRQPPLARVDKDVSGACR
jgi:hypothetical protein